MSFELHQLSKYLSTIERIQVYRSTYLRESTFLEYTYIFLVLSVFDIREEEDAAVNSIFNKRKNEISNPLIFFDETRYVTKSVSKSRSYLCLQLQILRFSFFFFFFFSFFFFCRSESKVEYTVSTCFNARRTNLFSSISSFPLPRVSNRRRTIVCLFDRSAEEIEFQRLCDDLENATRRGRPNRRGPSWKIFH